MMIVDITTAEYAAAMWKANGERNKSSMKLPNGSSYKDYCEKCIRMGRSPLPYLSLWEDFDCE